MACPGSVRAAAGKAVVSSSYAELGTAAHTLFEMCMRLDDTPDAWLGRTVHNHVVDEDMANAVGYACDFVRSYLATQPLAEWHAEHITNAGQLFGRKDVWGTSDTVIDNRALRELIVLDYKHGAGVYVEVEDNAQLMIYALGYIAGRYGSLARAPYERIVLVVVQPRAFGPGGPVRQHVLSMEEMGAFSRRLFDAASATDAPDAPLVPGEHCRFCPASAQCPALAQHAMDTAREEFTPIVDQDPARLAYLLRQVPVIDAWCRALETAAEQHLLRGHTLPGFKLVRGRTSYFWQADPERVLSQLKACGLTEDQAAPRELISVATARKMLGGTKKQSVFNTQISPMVGRSTPKLTLAAEEDPRPAVEPMQTEFSPEPEQ